MFEPSTSEILLIADVLIGCHHHVETRLFRYFEKFPVFQLVRQPISTTVWTSCAGRKETRTNGYVFIEQDAQRDGS